MGLGNSKITAVIPVADVSPAQTWYENVLGLSTVSSLYPGEVIMQCGGDTKIELYQSPTGASASEATIATWTVDDIMAMMEELRGKGVTFEDYDMPDFKTENGVFTQGNMKASWFKDPDGNILCLHQINE